MGRVTFQEIVEMNEKEKKALQQIARMLHLLGVKAISEAEDFSAFLLQSALDDMSAAMDNLFPVIKEAKGDE